MAFLKKHTNSIVPFKDLKPSMTGSKISVLILRLWRKNFKGGGPMEMILVDSQGDRIHATVDSDLASKYDAKLREGLAVTIESFKVTPYVGDYRTNPHPFKISFFRTTDVLKCEKFPSVVPEKYIADFTRINTSVMDKAIMIDVVGQIVDVQPLTEIISKGKNLSKLDFYFVDELSTKLLCTFWGDYAKAFWKFISQHKDTQVVCLIRFVAVKEYRSSWHVTNSYDATQYFYNSDIPTIKRFNTMLPPDSLSLTINNSAPPTVPLYQEFFELNKKKSIYDIVYSNEECVCVTVGTVDSIDASSWYYIVCAACKDSVHPYPVVDDVAMFDCETYGKISDIDAKYRLILNVSDTSTVSAKFFFFYGIAKQLLERGAAELAQEIAHDDQAILPLAIKQLVGQTMLFKVNINKDNLRSRYHSFKVEKYWTKADIVTKFIDRFCMKDSTLINIDGDSMELKIDSVVPLDLKRSP